MTSQADLDRSLEDLENDRWGPAPPDTTRLIATAHVLRRRPIGELSIEDLRLLIGQRIGLERLVPLAVARLEQNPLAEGDMYPGDLLAAVMRVDLDFWARHRDVAARLTTALPALAEVPAHLVQAVADFANRTGPSL